jgi:hypothetical protein
VTPQGGDSSDATFYPNAPLTNLPFGPGLFTLGPVTALNLVSYGGSFGVPSVRTVNGFSSFLVGSLAAPINGSYGSLQGQEVSAVPLPSSLPMFAAGLLALSAFAWRRRKQIKVSKSAEWEVSNSAL